jgi:GntR family transcriptional regulator, rspAB operon transcriptional repressor
MPPSGRNGAGNPGRVPRGGARSSKTAHIYQTLRGEILTTLLPPGTILVENGLAARFSVSKTPIREALALLQQDRLVDSLPRKGYLVTAVTVDDQRELIELRAAIDGAAAELAARRITPQEIEALERLVLPAESFDARAAKRHMELNRKFHVAIGRASGNQRLAQLVERLVDETVRLFAPGFHMGEHREIIDALRTGDGKRARGAAVNHILMTQDRARKRETTGFSFTAADGAGALPRALEP